MLRMYMVNVNVDNGMERFGWHAFVFANSAEEAIECVKHKSFDEDDLVEVLSVAEVTPHLGMILYE